MADHTKDFRNAEFSEAQAVVLGEKFAGLERRFDHLDGRMDRLEGRMDRLETRMDALGDRITSFQNTVMYCFVGQSAALLALSGVIIYAVA